MNQRELKAFRKAGLETVWSQVRKTILSPSISRADTAAYSQVLFKNNTLWQGVVTKEVLSVFDKLGREVEDIFTSPEYEQAKAILLAKFPSDEL
jgi:hypothetical protein